MMGELNFFLGQKIKKTFCGTSICQGMNTKKLLKKSHIVDCKHIDTPMGINSKIGADEADYLVKQTMYGGIIGTLLYLTTFNSHILFSVGMYTQYQACPGNII